MADDDPFWTFSPPPSLERLEEQISFCIGVLVGEWANGESLLYGIFECIVGKIDTSNGAIIWGSYQNSRARLDLLHLLANSGPLPDELRKRLRDSIKLFRGITRTRNFWCHCLQIPDYQTNGISHFYSATLDPEKNFVVVEEKKPADKATLNELVDTIRRLRRLNKVAWELRGEIQEVLQAHYLPRPIPPAAYL